MVACPGAILCDVKSVVALLVFSVVCGFWNAQAEATCKRKIHQTSGRSGDYGKGTAYPKFSSL